MARCRSLLDASREFARPGHASSLGPRSADGPAEPAMAQGETPAARHGVGGELPAWAAGAEPRHERKDRSARNGAMAAGRPELGSLQPWPDFAREFGPAALPSLETANRRFGGCRALLHPLRRLLASGWAQPIRILDVATGAGDIPRALVSWGRARGIRLRIVGVDLHPMAAASAAAASRDFPEIRIVRGDAFALPWRPGAFDIVTCSMFLHYLPTARAAALLRGFAALEPRAILVSDLVRHWFPLLAMRTLSRVSRSPLFGAKSRHTVSLGFTRPELQGLVRQLAPWHWRVERSFPFRFCLVGRLAHQGPRLGRIVPPG